MIREYDDHLGYFDTFNKELYIKILGYEPHSIKSVEIESKYLLKFDSIENSFYITSSIPVYITIEVNFKDIVHLVLLNEDIYLNDEYLNEKDFEVRISEIELELKGNLLK